MTRKTRNILLIIAAALIMVNILAIAVKRGDNSISKNFEGILKTSSTSVKINDVAIPSYEFKNSIYIAAEDLQLFGFKINYNGNVMNISNESEDYSYREEYFSSLSHLKNNTDVMSADYITELNGKKITAYSTRDYTIIPLSKLGSIGTFQKSDTSNAIICTLISENGADSYASGKTQPNDVTVTPPTVEPKSASINSSSGVGISSGGGNNSGKKIIVLDPGHGKSSSEMSADEKREYGWIYNEARGQWGEWRHWKSGTTWEDCKGSGCSGRVTPNGGEWYSIGAGDRDVEPNIDLQNSLAAKKYLEEMGYTVRMTRTSNEENPSITQRLKNCYPNKNTSAAPDADAFICIHSNAGGGRGTSYIALSGNYDQKGIPGDYAARGNALGKAMNDKIAAATSLSNNGSIDSMPELIAFCKSPVTCAYLEIGFFDDSSDLSILKNESDAIGKAIAEGIDSFFNN